MNKIKFGIIGTGFGARVMLPCLNYIDGINVIVLANTKGEVEKEILDNYKEMEICDVDEIFNKSDIDAICIETPPVTHNHLIKKSIDRKIPIICEKPFVLNEDDAATIINKVEETKIFACINHQLRFHPNIIKLRKLIQGGELGMIRHVELNHHSSQKFNVTNFNDWWFNESSGGGQLNALGSHFIDLVIYLFGDISKVYGNLESYYENKSKLTENYCSLFLKLNNGISCNITSSSATSSDIGLNLLVSGSKKKVIMSNFNKLTLFNDQENVLGEDISTHDSLLGKEIIGLNPWRTSLVYHLSHIRDVLQNNVDYGGCTFKDGLKVLKVINAVKLSNDLRKEIEIDYL